MVRGLGKGAACGNGATCGKGAAYGKGAACGKGLRQKRKREENVKKKQNKRRMLTAITLQHCAFVTKYVAHFVAQSLLFATVTITLF